MQSKGYGNPKDWDRLTVSVLIDEIGLSSVDAHEFISQFRNLPKHKNEHNVRTNIQEKISDTDNDGNKYRFQDCISSARKMLTFRHFILIWMPVLDITTDILTIRGYMNSNSSSVFSFGLLLACIVYLSLRLQEVIFEIYYWINRASRG
eukprot:78503_1